MNTTAVALRDTTVPANIQKLEGDYGLAPAETREIQIWMQDYGTNLPTIRELLDKGLEHREVQQLLEARSRIQLELDGQIVSLKQLLLFQQTFPSVPLDADSLVDLAQKINQRLKRQYLDQMLRKMRLLHARYPDALPEALADMMAGESNVCEFKD